MVNNCFPNFPQGVNCGIKPWRWQCLQILPTIFDESLSYYENICKLQVVIAQIVQEGIQTDKDITQLQEEMQEVQTFIDNWNENSETIIKNIIQTIGIGNVIFSLTSDGRFMVTWYDNWYGVTWGTTGYDINIPGYDYGHLVINN